MRTGARARVHAHMCVRACAREHTVCVCVRAHAHAQVCVCVRERTMVLVFDGSIHSNVLSVVLEISRCPIMIFG